MQKKSPNPKSDLRAMYLNKSGSTFWHQIFAGLQPAFLIQSYSILRWFRYETELPWVLKGLSFSIQPGAGLLMKKLVGMGYTFSSKAVLELLGLFESSHNASLD